MGHICERPLLRNVWEAFEKNAAGCFVKMYDNCARGDVWMKSIEERFSLHSSDCLVTNKSTI